ncbi:MAG: transglutaminase-like domain-containing protein [Bacteroidales bacterium]|nr:transglutaminase-like domain-containing protein [Bacteroidales bacterium]MCM1147468.1 transglutaminase-like domain-containing protein [Bacteroidales bacterium]MCM1206137.1 transglutaminase-like domain-containing protein [Bacillota bacterium]MCM1510032.1 transglutaminase-like domain-containing protein [Clostridium sp.]
MNCSNFYTLSFNTSRNNANNICFSIKNKKLAIEFPKGIPERLIWVFDAEETEYLKKKTTSTQDFLNLCSLDDGFYYVNIYLKSSNDYYNGYIHGKEVVIEIRDNIPHIKLCPFFFWNKHLLEHNGLAYSFPTTIEDNIVDVLALAQKITESAQSLYKKILLIHDWIADNLYYDLDAIKEKRLNNASTNRSILQILAERKCVCQGYNDVAVALLSALGIRCESLICFSLGASSDGGWNKKNRKADLNHVITRAFDGKHWILMDITWDSCNRFEGGQFIRDSKKPSHKYFDISLELISSTHKFTKNVSCEE